MPRGKANYQTVSRVHEPRLGGRYAAFPAIRLNGKWLEDHCKIGDRYTVEAQGNELRITIHPPHAPASVKGR